MEKQSGRNKRCREDEQLCKSKPGKHTGSSEEIMDGVAFVAGGCAGLAVDVSLYPLDTLKTRLQSSKGFWASGGVKGLYSGLASAAVGSVPGASLFFFTYESTKTILKDHLNEKFQLSDAGVQMIAASLGEIAACLARVPTENVKQKLQAGLFDKTTAAMQSIVKENGLRGYYVGYGSTVMREIPFSMLQFPLWEAMKSEIARRRVNDGGFVHSWESAAAGSISGAFAAAATTPLDVVKTRLMLRTDARGVPYNGMVSTFMRVLNEEGVAKLFSGVGPRTFWIGIGGFVYFGAYEKTRDLLQK